MRRNHLSLNAPETCRNQLTIKMLFHFMLLSLHRSVGMDLLVTVRTISYLYLWPWMHKSYGVSKGCWSIVQIRWLTPKQWPMGVWKSTKKFNNPSVLRSLWYSCLIMDGTLGSKSLTLSTKVMPHCWCYLHRWEVDEKFWIPTCKQVCLLGALNLIGRNKAQCSAHAFWLCAFGLNPTRP